MKNVMAMLDERSGKWIQLYKKLTIVMCVLWVVFGVLGGIGDSMGEFLDFDLGGGDDGFLDFIVWIVAGVFGGGVVQLVTNMLVIQFLNNVQIIREKIENQ